MAAGKTNWKGKSWTGRNKRKKEDVEWLLGLGNNVKGRAQIQNHPWFQPRHKRITNHRMEPQGKIKDMKPKFNNPRQSPSFNSRANNYLQQILRKPGKGRHPETSPSFGHSWDSRIITPSTYQVNFTAGLTSQNVPPPAFGSNFD